MIVISPGHNPNAVGATYDGFSEYPNTLIWAHRIKFALDSMNVPCVVGPDVTLKKKVQFVNDFYARGEVVWAAIEIHFNAGGGHGPETLYHPKSKAGRALAVRVQAAMAKVFGKDRGVKEGWYKMDRPGYIDFVGDIDGDEQLDYYLRKTRCPAIIIEPEFVENHQEICVRGEAACAAIAEALYEHFKHQL